MNDVTTPSGGSKDGIIASPTAENELSADAADFDDDGEFDVATEEFIDDVVDKLNGDVMN